MDTRESLETADGKPTEKVKPLACRFHDLRHTFCSRALAAGVPLAKVGRIVGWSGSTMVLMAKRYRHFTLNELRDAVESASGGKIEPGSLVFSPAIDEKPEAKRPN